MSNPIQINHKTETNTQNLTIQSSWVNASRLGMMGGRRRVVFILNAHNELESIQLISQTALGRLADFMKKAIGQRDHHALTSTLLPAQPKLIEAWKHSCQILQPKTCQEILSQDLRKIMSISTDVLQIELNSKIASSLEIALIQQLGKQFSAHLEHFSNTIGLEWEAFIQNLLTASNESNLANHLLAITAKQNALIIKCHTEAQRDIDNALRGSKDNDAAYQNLPPRLAAYNGKDADIDLLLSERQNQWRLLSEKVNKAESIETLDGLAEAIIDANMLDDALCEFLKKTSDFDNIHEAVQLRCKELLLQLAPHNSTFQGLHSPRALTSAFIEAQIAPYQKADIKLKLSETQRDTIEDIKTAIGCLGLMEQVVQSKMDQAQVLEKQRQVKELLDIKKDMTEATLHMQKHLKSLITDHHCNDDAAIEQLHIYLAANKLLASVPENINWQNVPHGDIKTWMAQANALCEAMHQILAGKDLPSELNPLTSPDDANALVSLAPKFNSADPLQNLINKSFIDQLEKLLRKNIGHPAQTNPQYMAALKAHMDHLSAQLHTILSSCEVNSFPPSSSLKALAALMSALPLSDKNINHENLSITQLDQLLEMAQMLQQMLQNQAPQEDQVQDQLIAMEHFQKLISYCHCITFIAVAARNVLINRKSVMQFTANELEKLAAKSKAHPRFKESVAQAKEALKSIPSMKNFKELPLSNLTQYFDSSLKQLGIAERALNTAVSLKAKSGWCSWLHGQSAG